MIDYLLPRNWNDSAAKCLHEQNHLKIAEWAVLVLFSLVLVNFASSPVGFLRKFCYIILVFSVGILCPETESEVKNGNIEHNGKLLLR